MNKLKKHGNAFDIGLDPIDFKDSLHWHHIDSRDKFLRIKYIMNRVKYIWRKFISRHRKFKINIFKWRF